MLTRSSLYQHITEENECGTRGWVNGEIACNGHRLSGSLLWDSKSISKLLGGGPSFHAFNESKQPWGGGGGGGGGGQRVCLI